jgi:hypothetical protein
MSFTDTGSGPSSDHPKIARGPERVVINVFCFINKLLHQQKTPNAKFEINETFSQHRKIQIFARLASENMSVKDN